MYMCEQVLKKGKMHLYYKLCKLLLKWEHYETWIWSVSKSKPENRLESTLMKYSNEVNYTLTTFGNLIKVIHKPVSVNHEEVEFGLTVSNFTTWLKSLPLLTPTQTKGNSCSGTTSISNNRSGQGTGKSMCCIKKKRHSLPQRCNESIYMILLNILMQQKPEMLWLKSPDDEIFKYSSLHFEFHLQNSLSTWLLPLEFTPADALSISKWKKTSTCKSPFTSYNKWPKPASSSCQEGKLHSFKGFVNCALKASNKLP